MRILSALFVAAALACGGAQEATPDPEPAAVPAEDTLAPADAPAETPDDGQTPATDAEPDADKAKENCVTECVAARQMQATSPEAIEAACREECSK